MAPGEDHLNTQTIREATLGVAAYAKRLKGVPSLAIAYDSRNQSGKFARETAQVLALKGCKAYIYRKLMPTPALSFAVRYLKCDMGICITASHNPKDYNGYNPVRRVEIPKETKGEFRKLGVPTVVDRVIQQAIAQELSPIFEGQFSENSFGFRPKRGAHDALRQCQKNVNDGYVYVVDMDLEKFFDTVSQSKLIEVLSRTIKDGRVISLIHKYLNAGVVANGKFERTEIGMPQGGPLSPLLSNIMLNELDKELESRGHRFVRYADDCMIFCRSRKSAERTLENILPFIEEKLFLKVNRKKTQVAHISKVRYLGYSFYRYKGKCRVRVHPKSVTKMKNKIRELTDRNKGISNDVREKKYQEYVQGWVGYFRLADMRKLLKETDEWARRRIRAVYWKQWKKIKTKYRMLKALGLEHWRAKELACSRKGCWRMAQVLNQIFSNKTIAKLGYISMLDYYLVVYEN